MISSFRAAVHLRDKQRGHYILYYTGCRVGVAEKQESVHQRQTRTTTTINTLGDAYIYNTQSGSTTRTRLVPLYSSASSSFLRAIHSALFHQILPLASNPWPSVPIAYVQPGLNAGWLTVSRIARQGGREKKRATI